MIGLIYYAMYVLLYYRLIIATSDIRLTCCSPISGIISPNWWLVEDQNYTCTGEQRAEVLHMTLSVDIFDSSYLDNEGYYTSMNIVSACNCYH